MFQTDSGLKRLFFLNHTQKTETRRRFFYDFTGKRQGHHPGPEGIGYYPDGGVVTDGGKIVEVGTTAELKAKYPQAEFVDAKGGVIMPGLINAHTHIYSALARGLSINGYNPTSFYEVLDGQWWYIDRNLDLEATKASAQAPVIDSIKQGVTTIFDHHASFCEIPGSLMKIAEVTEEFGMRACLCYEVTDRDGEEKSIQSVQENKDFIDYCEQEPLRYAEGHVRRTCPVHHLRQDL